MCARRRTFTQSGSTARAITGDESYPDYLDLRDRNRSFEGLVAYNVTQVGLDTGGNPSQAWIEEASGNYFDELGLQPYLGRFFHASDEHGAEQRAVHCADVWVLAKPHFQADRGVVGRVVRLNKHPYTIIGVAPQGFHGTMLFFNPDFFVPLMNSAELEGQDLNRRGMNVDFHDHGALEGRGDQARGDGGSERDRGATGEELSEGRWQDRLLRWRAEPVWATIVGRPVRAFRGGIDAAGGR